MLTWTRGIVVGTVVTLVLLYFLLASGDTFIRKLAKLLRLEQKTRVTLRSYSCSTDTTLFRCWPPTGW